MSAIISPTCSKIKVPIFVAFLDMQKAYDRVNRKKLFEVMRCYDGVHEKLVTKTD